MYTNTLTIGELSARYNCSLRTLRFYEERGLLAPTREGHQRYYSHADEIKLQLVLCGKRLGLSLREVQALILERSERSPFNATRMAEVALLLPREKITDQIALLTERKVGLDAAIAELKDAQARDMRVEEAMSA